jgi:oligo-1,6-glucosidase/alpha-glucosidase
LQYPPAEDGSAGFFQRWQYNLNQPETIQLAQELRRLVDTYSPERLLLSELFADDHTLRRYLSPERNGLHLAFLWGLPAFKLDARFFRELLTRYETGFPAPYTPIYVLGNHDRKRFISNLDDDPEKAKLLALIQFSARGVPVTYYGEEIGMTEVQFSPKTALDPVGRRYSWAPDWLVNLLDVYVNRDGCRTPMQWDAGPNAGFCPLGATPWLPISADYPTINVETESAAADSLLNFYRRLLRLRKDHPPLRVGLLHLLEEDATGQNLLGFRRGEDVLVLINFGGAPTTFCNRSGCRHVLLSVGVDHISDPERVTLPAFSGVVLGRQ